MTDTSAASRATRPDSPENKRRRRILPWALPLGLVGIGVAGYALLSREPVRAKSPPAKPQPIRTQVVPLHARDFPVVIKTHGVTRAHNETTLSSLVSGKIARINPQFEDGSFFSAGEVLLELEAEDYRTAVAVAEARLLSARAALELAHVSHERNVELLKENLLPRNQADTTAASLSQATADVNSTTAQLERARRDLERTQIRAPFNGCVRKRSVGLGQLVGPGTSLGTIFGIDSAEVRLPIAGRELRFLDIPESPDLPGPAVELHDAISPDSDVVWQGRIIRSEGALDENSLDLFVIARVEDPFGRKSGAPPLRIGQPVTGAIRGLTLTNVVALPRLAVRQLDRILLVEQPAMTLRGRRIIPLWQDETHVVIREPSLPDGALLATTHLVYAPDGARVEIIPELKSSPGPAPAPATAARP